MASLAKYEGLTMSMRWELLRALNNSLASSTIKQYKTTVNHLARMGVETGSVVSLPMTEESVLKFIAWLRINRGVAVPTIEKHLSALRALHAAAGVAAPELRTQVARMALRGWTNR